MCGISGIVNLRGITQKDIIIIKNIAKLSKHRGPDESGEYCDNKVFFNFNRLSIIGIDNGSQPIISDDQQIILMANGEIYNYLEIKQKLIKKGVKFKTKTDVEVILKIYEIEGINGINKLRGMFSFLIYDKKKKKFFLCRDRLGEKPLYYYFDKNKLIFNSEFKSILDQLDSVKLDHDSVNQYLFNGYIMEPRTMVKDIQKLKAGHILILDLLSKDFSINLYWSIIGGFRNDSEINFEKKLNGIFKIITRSEVKNGLALSGGLDSSFLAKRLSKSSKNNNIECFSMFYESFANPNENFEFETAKNFAEENAINFSKCSISDNQMIKDFEEMVYSLDEPISDLSSSNYFQIAKYAKKNNLKVIFLGHGIDEFFWGYDDINLNLETSYILINKNNNDFQKFFKIFLLFIPSFNFREIVLWVLKFFFIPKIFHLLKIFKKKKLLPFGDNNFESDYYLSTLRKYFSKKFANKIKFKNCNEEIQKNYNNINEENLHLIFIDMLIKTYLRENGLSQIDKLFMSQGVESRLPYLDYKFVEDVIKMKEVKNDYSFGKKFFFKKLALNFLNTSIVNQKKRGFSSPIRWTKKLYEKYYTDLFISKKSNIEKLFIFEKNFFSSLMKSFFFKRYFFYRILVLEVWLQKNNLLKKINS